MKQFRFTGHSDDLLCIDGAEYPVDELSVLGGHEDSIAVQVYSKATKSGVTVFAQHAPEAHPEGWVIGVSPSNEDEPMADWPMRFERGHGYSACLVIDAPDDAEIITDIAGNEDDE